MSLKCTDFHHIFYPPVLLRDGLKIKLHKLRFEFTIPRSQKACFRRRRNLLLLLNAKLTPTLTLTITPTEADLLPTPGRSAMTLLFTSCMPSWFVAFSWSVIFQWNL